MTEAEAKAAADTLGIMAEAERAIARLYEACAEADADRAEVWKRIAAAERNHAAWVERMAHWLVERRGDGFRAGRKFTPEAAQAFIDLVRKSEKDVRAGELKGRVLYMVTRGLEDSLLEERYYEMVATTDKDFSALVERIKIETRDHRALMHAWASAAGA